MAMLLAEEPAQPRPFVLVPLGAEAEASAMVLARDLRHAGFTVELGFSGNLKKRMQRANKMAARAAVFLGDEEIQQRAVTLRDLDSGVQELVPLDALRERLSQFS
jgi:histidyl-tRNA synthetase